MENKAIDKQEEEKISKSTKKRPWVTPELIDLDIPRKTASGQNTQPDGATNGSSLS